MTREPPGPSLFFWTAWLILSVAALLVVPTWIGYGAPVWEAERSHLGLGLAGVQLVSGLIIVGNTVWNQQLSAPQVVTIAGTLLGALYLAYLTLDISGYSRAVLLSGTGLVLLFTLLPSFWAWSRTGTTLLGILGLCGAAAFHLLGGTARVGGLVEQATSGAPERPSYLSTAHHTLEVDYLTDLIPRDEVTGGAIATVGDSYLVVTGSGRFYRLRRRSADGSLASTALTLRAPLNHGAFTSATGPEVNTDWFRTADVLAETSADSVRLLVTHHHWDQERECYVVRVSRLETSVPDLWQVDQPNGGDRWETFFETEPCLSVKRSRRGWPFAGHQAGGRLAPLGSGRYLLTVGDHEFDGWNSERALPQRRSADYGKILLLRADGNSSIYTTGHRNPQGLHVDPDDRIWSTEHGPQGGDELNLIREDGDYGWPHATLGTEYGMHRWPMTDTADRAFTRPVFAWTPSIGISNLIAVRGSTAFERWRGDLLIASLRGNRLFRTRVREDRVINLEGIEIGGRIRDLAQGPTGEIVLFLDRETIVRLSPADLSDDGAAIFAAECASCHGTGEGRSNPIGPDLQGVFKRKIGWLESYAYSESLASRDGTWNEENLDAFLADPQEFAPGTTMEWDGIGDEERRRALIAYLKGR